MPDTYKLQYDGYTLTFPGFNGFLNYKPEYRLFVHYPFAVTGVYSLSTPTELTNLSGKVTKFNFECQGLNARPDSYYVALFSGYPGEIIQYQDMESHLITSATYKNQTGEFASGVLYVPDDYAEKVKIGASSLFLSFARGGSTMFLVGNPSAIGYETVLDNEPSIRNINYTLNGSGEEGYMPNSAVPGEIIPLMFGNATATVEGANTASYTYASWPEKGYEVADSDINVTVTYPIYNLTLQTDGHGTLTAETLTGYPGDTSILTYAANSNYAFSGYSIVGGGSLQNNTYTFGNKDGIVKAWFSAIPTSALYYSTDSVWAGKSETISINKPCTAFQYVAIQFNQSGYGGGGAEAQTYNINGFGWNMRWHYTIKNYKPLRNGGSYTAINSNTGTRTTDKTALRYYKGVAENANAKFKLVVDRNTNIASAFWNNTVICKGGVNASTAITTIWKNSEQNYTPRNVGRIRCGGFKYLSDAAAWNP